MQPLSITQASATAAVTTIVGMLVAFIPSIAQWQSEIIAIGAASLSVAFLVVNALHAHAAAKVTAAARLSQGQKFVAPR